jgi:two-component system, cell cycle sensor histidine kinase and response regulator CckA
MTINARGNNRNIPVWRRPLLNVFLVALSLIITLSWISASPSLAGDFPATKQEAESQGWLDPETRSKLQYVNIAVIVALLGLISGCLVLMYRLKEKVASLKIAQKKLLAQNEILLMAMEATHAAIWDFYPAKGSGYLNREWYAMFGYPPRETDIPLDEWRSFIHPDDLTAVDCAFAEYIETGGSGIFEAEFRIRRGDGSWCWVLSKGRTFARDEKGRPLRIIGLNLNIQRFKEVQEKLAQSEAKFRAIFEYAPFAAVINSLDDGRFLDVNNIFLDVHGVSREELGKMTIKDLGLIHEEDPSRLLKTLSKTGAVRNVEASLLRKDGSCCNIMYSCIVLDIQGTRQTLSMIVDITEKKRAEKALLENMELLRATFNATTDGILVVSTEGKITQANRQFYEMWRVPDYLRGEEDDELMLSFVADQVANHDAFLAKVRTLYQSRLEDMDEIVLQDGRVFERYSTPMILKGNEIGRVWDFRDISERNKAEEALRKSEQLFRGFVENATDLIFAMTLEGVLTYLSPNWLDLMGEPAAEGIGRSFEFYVHPDDHQMCWDVFKKVLETGEQLESANFRAFRHDGSIYLYAIKTTPQCDENGNMIGFMGIARDITQQKRAEDERQKLQEQLVQAQKLEAIGVLAGGVAHDFNNMLGVIIGYSELLMGSMEATDPLRDNLGKILEAAERSAALTRQLLAFARKQTVNPIVLDLNEAIEAILKMLRRLIGENVSLVWLPGAAPCMVKMDPSQLDQILANLCVNAKDAITNIGKITIKTDIVSFDEDYCKRHAGCAPGNYALLAVSDDGCGMDRETQEHIFEPFFTTKAVGQGTGLGLATVYGIARQNEGLINVYSEPGKGSTFKLYIPCHIAGDMTTKPAVAETIPGSRGETVLIVEDDPVLLEMSSMMLQHLGYSVLSADRPAEAIRIAQECRTVINLFITDVVMPEMNGRDLAERLLAIRPTLKHLFMSGYTADVIAHQGVLDEGVNFIQKPFSLMALAVKVREILD